VNREKKRHQKTERSAPPNRHERKEGNGGLKGMSEELNSNNSREKTRKGRTRDRKEEREGRSTYGRESSTGWIGNFFPIAQRKGRYV